MTTTTGCLTPKMMTMTETVFRMRMRTMMVTASQMTVGHISCHWHFDNDSQKQRMMTTMVTASLTETRTMMATALRTTKTLTMMVTAFLTWMTSSKGSRLHLMMFC